MNKPNPLSTALVIFSGGQDSTTCLFWAMKRFDKVEAITFAYGQKHSVEVHCSQEICLMNDIKQTIVDIGFLKTINDSAMVHGGDTGQMKNGLPTSFVPNRNALFITLADMYARKAGINNIVTGVCETDYSGYPDCRAGFIDSINQTLSMGNNDDWITIHTPLMYLTKAETWQLAEELGRMASIIEYTHTCYEGDHTTRNEWGYGCGKCPACVLRANGYKEYHEQLLGKM